MWSSDNGSSWLEFVPETESEGQLAQAYRSVAGPDGRVDNLYKAMSLSPAAIEPADKLYKALLCGCEYAAINHGENFHDFYGNRSESEELLAAIRQHHLPIGPGS